MKNRQQQLSEKAHEERRRCLVFDGAVADLHLKELITIQERRGAM
jgi:hypothetical protein